MSREKHKRRKPRGERTDAEHWGGPICGRYAPSALAPMLRYVNLTLLAWAMRKLKRFKAHKVRAGKFLQRLAAARSDLFAHWQLGLTGVFN